MPRNAAAPRLRQPEAGSSRDIVVVTGAAGLVGSETVRLFSQKGYRVIGIDNDMRGTFFGGSASNDRNRRRLIADHAGYRHCSIDIRDRAAVEQVFEELGSQVCLIVHTAAQPSHDWAARDPHTDFTVNANGTLVLLECFRAKCPDAVFIFTSTNKVYGDAPNLLPLVELETRWEVAAEHAYCDHGIDESLTIDQSKHSLFGVSKLSADLMVQEYGRYFGLKTGVFRCGCITGPAHSGAPLHGFLAYLMRCAATGERYTVFGYEGKQVRDNIHSYDLTQAFWHFFNAPRSAEVYNMGGGRRSNCSMREAVTLCEMISGRPLDWVYTPDNRSGDHIWWISDCRKFSSHYPGWTLTYDVPRILEETYAANREQWKEAS